MRTQSLRILVVCLAIACLAIFQQFNQAAAGESNSQRATLVHIEPVPDADDGMGEASLSDFDSTAETYPGTQAGVAPKNVSLVSMVDENPATVCNDVCNDACNDTCADACDVTCDGGMCARSSRSCGKLWARADYLLWWTRGSRVPALVTTSTDQNDNGILGQPTTSVLYGDNRDASDARSSMRYSFGYWFDSCQTCGVEFDYFDLGQYNNNFDEFSDGETLLARPIYSVLQSAQGAELVAKRNVVEGRVRVDADDYFQSMGVLWRKNLCCHQPCGDCGDGLCSGPDDYGCGDSCGARNRGSLRDIFTGLKDCKKRISYRVDFIGGYRNYRLDDNISVTENLETLASVRQMPAGTTFDIEDSFRATNEFHGGELGIITKACRGRWSLELLTKMALGNNSSIVNITGSTDVDRPGDDPVHYDEGILALRTNIGRYHRDQFIVIPQFGIEVGYDLTCNLRAYCGYNFIYWAQVYRAAEQIDTNVNTSYVPPVVAPQGELAPTFSFTDSDFWAQGLNLGLEWNF